MFDGFERIRAGLAEIAAEPLAGVPVAVQSQRLCELVDLKEWIDAELVRSTGCWGSGGAVSAASGLSQHTSLATDIRAGSCVDFDDLPIAPQPSKDGDDVDPAPSTRVTATSVPVEQHHTVGRYEVSHPLSPVLAERLEQPLVRNFCDFLNAGGYPSERVRYTLDGVDYVTDIVVRSAGLLVEAKYHVGRGSIRMALGQVKDYDFMESEANRSGFVSLAVLLGGRPTESALRYIAREDVEAIWAVGDDWAATDKLKEELIGCQWS